MKQNLLAAVILLSLFSACPGLNAQTVLRVSGATSLEKLLSPHKAELEKACGQPVEIVGKGASRGLLDLASGAADVAMIGGPLDGVAAAANLDKPGSVDASKMQALELKSIEVVLAANASVSLKSVTTAQAKDLLTGVATNWKMVGGPDVPVKIAVPYPGDGVRIVIDKAVLSGAPVAKEAIVRNTAKELAPIVGQLPGAFAPLSLANASATPGLSLISFDPKLLMPLSLVTNGAPSPVVAKFIEAAKAIAAGN